jgi:hypothetical protein
MIRRLRLSFPDERAIAVADLLWNIAPKTCESISALLPLSGRSHHAIYSGSECVLLLDSVLRLKQENATSSVSRGDIGFTWMAAGSSYGVNRDFAEICWFYDLDAAPRMWEGPVSVNLFARIVGPAEEFYKACYRMRRDGAKSLEIEAIP